jgi:hypothetical protein
MVFVNVIASFILIVGLGFYRYIFPKKKINLLVILTLLSILPIISIFRQGDYQSGDFNTHIYRSIDFFTSLTQGQLLPSWAENLNATFGYPLFIFAEPLPYYLVSLIHFTGFSFILSLKVVLALSYISSGLFFYLWAKKEKLNTFAAFSGSVIYLFTPYHLIDLHFRADIGEVLALTFLPLFFYCLRLYINKQSLNLLFVSGLAYSLLTFAHQATSAFSLLIIVPYITYHAYCSKNKIKRLFTYSLPVLLGLVYSLYAWLPHLIYTKYTYAYALAKQGILFQSVNNLLYSPWRFGFLFQGPQGQLEFIIGYTELFIILVSIYTILKRKASGDLIFWTILSIFIIYLITPYSEWVWKLIPLLGIVQYSYRLLLILTFSISACMVYLTIFFKKYQSIVVLFLLLSIGYTILNWGQRTVIPQINDTSLIADLPESTIKGEGEEYIASPKWININNPWMSHIPKNYLEFVKGSGKIVTIKRTSVDHEYIIYTPSHATLKENTYYFPDWILKVDGKKEQLGVTKKSMPGLMQFTVQPGLHVIELSYHDLPEFFIAKIISVTTIFISLLTLLLLCLKKKIQGPNH